MQNTSIAYILTLLKNSYFWLGIWVLYYLKYTDYAGIGVIETAMIVTMVISEIPTGAIADLFGRKSALILAFLFMGIGQIYMGFSSNLFHLVTSVVVISLGHGFYSGTLEALIYDSLAANHSQKSYDKILSNISSIGLFSLAISSIIGGVIYNQNTSLPYILNGVFCLLGIPLCVFIKEDIITNTQFHFKQYYVQLHQGLEEIKRSTKINLIVFTLIFAAFITVTYEVLNNLLLVEYGLNSFWMGVAGAAMSIVAAIFSQATPYILAKLSIQNSVITVNISYALSLCLSMFGGLFGSINIVVRNGLETVSNNLNSILLNQEVTSKNRATSISTFNMIKSIPYVVIAFSLGKYMDTKGPILPTIYMGILSLIVIVVYMFFNNRSLFWQHKGISRR